MLKQALTANLIEIDEKRFLRYMAEAIIKQDERIQELIREVKRLRTQ